MVDRQDSPDLPGLAGGPALTARSSFLRKIQTD
jgi:hypothetical protein